MIEPKYPRLPIVRQCERLGLARASYYHQPGPEPDENLRLMRVIDETYLAHPEFGSRQMTRWLRMQGHRVNRKRIRRLMQLMSLEAIYQKPNTSRRHPEHRAYRYLLRHLKIERSNHVWAADITYVPVKGGFIYNTASIRERIYSDSDPAVRYPHFGMTGSFAKKGIGKKHPLNTR
jgi:putative transposase